MIGKEGEAESCPPPNARSGFCLRHRAKCHKLHLSWHLSSLPLFTVFYKNLTRKRERDRD